jgi:hypothetical protein
MNWLRILVLFGLLSMWTGCSSLSAPWERQVVFLAAEGFRGPFVIRIDSTSDVLPVIRGREVIYTIPHSRVLTVKTLERSNGSLWGNYRVQYPSGRTVSPASIDRGMDEALTYLWPDGSQKSSSENIVTFFVGRLAEHSKLRDLSNFDMVKGIEIWERSEVGRTNQAGGANP